MFQQKGFPDKSNFSNVVLTRESIHAGYALLFYQVLSTMCGVGGSVIRGNPRNSYYCEVWKFLNMYGIQLGVGGAYGHNFINISLYALVWWDSVVQHDGVWGVSAGYLYLRWSNGEYRYCLSNCAITHARWIHIKRCINLNNNEASPKR